MKHLFVGGPNDGQWLEVNSNHEYVKIYQQDKIPIPVNLNPFPTTATLRYFDYRRITWWDNESDQHYDLFIPTNMPTRELTRLMIENYRPKQDTKDEI